LKELDRTPEKEKTWWDCVKDDMESLGLPQKDVQSKNKWMLILSTDHQCLGTDGINM